MSIQLNTQHFLFLPKDDNLFPLSSTSRIRLETKALTLFLHRNNYSLPPHLLPHETV